MAYTLEKTWQYAPNIPPSDISSVTALQKSYLWFIKAALTGQTGGLSAGLWTCYYSCDGTTAGTAGDGIDRWTASYDATKIVNANAGSAHSWMVLRSPANFVRTGVYLYMIIDVVASTNALTLTFCVGAPTAGSTTAAPTQGASAWHHTGIQWSDGTLTQHFHCSLSSEGAFFLFNSKDTTYFVMGGLIVSKLADTRTLDTVPVVSFISYGSSSPGAFGIPSETYSTMGIQAYRLAGVSGFGWGSSYGGGEQSVCVLLYNILDTFTGGRQPLATNLSYAQFYDSFETTSGTDLPVYLFCPAGQAGGWTIKGRVPDLRICSSNGINVGSVAPGPAGPVTTISMGATWFPTGAALV
jgi:hypothetical protein